MSFKIQATFGNMLVWFILFIFGIKWYIKFGMKRNGSYTCLVGKTAIVTGANVGKYQYYDIRMYNRYYK